MKKKVFPENAKFLFREFDIVPLMYGSPEQYRNVYTASAKDGYRVTVRQKKDSDKLAIIESYLNR